MKRSLWIGVLTVCGLLVGGCSSGSGTTASSSAGTSSAASSSAASSSAAPSREAETSAAGSVTPATLDAQSTEWFEALCTGLGPSIQGLSGLGQDPAADPAQAQAAVVAKVEEASVAFGITAQTLASTPPPTFSGGAELAAAIAAGLTTAATQLPQSAATFAAVNPADAAALAAAEQTLGSELGTALAPLQGISQLDPSVSAAVAGIPTCKALGS